MNNSITVASDVSAFDAIRHIDESGNEYWLARELASLLGYEKWYNFKNVVGKAELIIENTGGEKARHVSFTPGSEKNINSKGRPSENYKLTREACKLVVMNCDPNKLPVALGQRFFAAGIQEAETQQQKQVEPKPKHRTIWDLSGQELAMIATYQQFRKQLRTDKYCRIMVESIEPEFWRMSEEIAQYLMDRFEANAEFEKLKLYKLVMAFEQIEVKKNPEVLLAEAFVLSGIQTTDIFEAAKILAEPIVQANRTRIEQKFPVNPMIEAKAKAFQSDLDRQRQNQLAAA